MKTNQLTINVARTAAENVDAHAIPVASDGPLSADITFTRAQLTALGFNSAVGQTLVLPNGKSKYLIVVGIGEAAKANADVLRTSAAALARAASKMSSVATTLANVGRGDRAEIAQAVTEGLILATHRYDALRGEKKLSAKLKSVTLVTLASIQAAVVRGAQRGEVIADAVCLARDLANMPPAHLTAKMIAERAQKSEQKLA